MDDLYVYVSPRAFVTVNVAPPPPASSVETRANAYVICCVRSSVPYIVSGQTDAYPTSLPETGHGVSNGGIGNWSA